MVRVQNLTRKKALGTGPNSAVQAEYALDGNVLITVLKVWASSFYCTCVLGCMFYGRALECLVNQICEHASVICKLLAKVSLSQSISSMMLHDLSNNAKLRRFETYPQSALRSLAHPAVYAAG